MRPKLDPITRNEEAQIGVEVVSFQNSVKIRPTIVVRVCPSKSIKPMLTAWDTDEVKKPLSYVIFRNSLTFK